MEEKKCIGVILDKNDLKPKEIRLRDVGVSRKKNDAG